MGFIARFPDVACSGCSRHKDRTRPQTQTGPLGLGQLLPFHLLRNSTSSGAQTASEGICVATPPRAEVTPHPARPLSPLPSMSESPARQAPKPETRRHHGPVLPLAASTQSVTGSCEVHLPNGYSVTPHLCPNDPAAHGRPSPPATAGSSPVPRAASLARSEGLVRNISKVHRRPQ